MNTLHNVPIILSYEENGEVSAHCPLLPDCHCRCSSRTLALRLIQRLVKETLAKRPADAMHKGKKYEVVHLAVTPTLDSVSRLRKRRPKPESPRLEVL